MCFPMFSHGFSHDFLEKHPQHGIAPAFSVSPGASLGYAPSSAPAEGYVQLPAGRDIYICFIFSFV